MIIEEYENLSKGLKAVAFSFIFYPRKKTTTTTKKSGTKRQKEFFLQTS